MHLFESIWNFVTLFFELLIAIFKAIGLSILAIYYRIAFTLQDFYRELKLGHKEVRKEIRNLSKKKSQ